jgi:hypothetical protein
MTKTKRQDEHSGSSGCSSAMWWTCANCGKRNPTFVDPCECEPPKSKYRQDIDSIRFAMQELLDQTDRFSTVADKSDEARLDGMRAMLATFNLAVIHCASR